MTSLPPCSCPPMATCERHGVVKQPRTEKMPAPKSRRRKGLAPESEDMKKLKKRWAFIKACMILSQRRTNGYTSCMECGAVDPERLDLDHITPAGNGGTWTPDNAQLLCAGVPGSCHSKKHGEPQWSKAS